MKFKKKTTLIYEHKFDIFFLIFILYIGLARSFLAS